MRPVRILAVVIIAGVAISAHAQASPSAESYLSRGNDRYTRGDLDGAIDDFGLAIAFDPKWAAAHDLRANAVYSKGNISAAIADYTTAIELNPRHASTHNDRPILETPNRDPSPAPPPYTKPLPLPTTLP